MNSRKLFSKLLAKSLLVSTVSSCFGCCVSAMEIKNKYDTKTAIINSDLVFKILKNSTQWVMLKYLKSSKKKIPALLRNTKIDLNLFKQDIVKFLDEKYEKHFKEVEEYFKETEETFKNHVVAAKQTLEQPNCDNLIRMFVFEFLKTFQSEAIKYN